MLTEVQSFMFETDNMFASTENWERLAVLEIFNHNILIFLNKRDC